MSCRSTAGRSAVTILVVLGLSGCAPDEAPVTGPSNPPAATAPSDITAPLPDGAVLTGLLNRLADPAVPGAQKFALIEDATPGDATTLDNFTAALRDNQMVPLTFGFESASRSDIDPATVVAMITIIPPPPKSRFSFPMDFVTSKGDWKLSRDTAEQLLAFGNGMQAAPATPTR